MLVPVPGDPQDLMPNPTHMALDHVVSTLREPIGALHHGLPYRKLL